MSFIGRLRLIPAESIVTIRRYITDMSVKAVSTKLKTSTFKCPAR